MDDPKTFDVLNHYLEEIHAGKAPDRERFLKEHPELASALDCLEALDQMIGPADSAPTIDGGAQTPAPEATAREFPAAFGKFELLEEVGRGGMGVVYRARQPDLDRIVAIKMILSSHLASGLQVERFAAEARTMARLQHPHVVRIHETGQVHGQHYMVMEYIAGPSLAQELRRGPAGPEQAARWVATVARAVDHLHQQGIVHRDLKPSNILLDEQGRPFVTDFGLVKMLGNSQLTTTGAIVGTPSYMAPEQAAGRTSQVGPSSDIYSLGAILYELLTGRPPFQEETPLDTLVQVIEGEPVPPRRLNPAVPEKLAIICMKCLEKRSEERYASAAALADDLDRFLGGDDIEARRPGLPHLVRRWARREPALVFRLMVLAVMMLIVQVNYQLTHGVSRFDHMKVIGILAVWLAASFLCQRWLRSERWADLAPVAWSGADVCLLTAILALAWGPVSPLLVGYPFLITASGLWFWVPLVWFTTVACEVSWALVYFSFVDDPFSPYHYPPHYPVIFATALAGLGFVVAYQVQRVRALNRYYEHRPLP